MENWWPKNWPFLKAKPNIWLVVIVLISLGVRLALPASMVGSEGRSRFLRVAQHVADGRGYTLCWPEYFPFCGQPGNDQTASAEPVPVLVYAGIIKVLGSEQNEGLSQQGIITLQVILGLVTIVLVYKVLEQLFKRPDTALVGAWLWGIYIPMMVTERDFLDTTLFTFFLTTGILALLYGWRSQRAVSWALTGFYFGLASLSRSTLLYCVPVLIVVTVLVSPAATRRKLLVNVGLCLITFSLILTPWVARNALVFGAFIPDSTLKGYNLFRHNHIIAGENYLRYVSLKEVEQAIQQKIAEGIKSKRTDVRGHENEFEMDQLYRREALAIIQMYPERYVALSLYRLWPLLTDAGINGPLTTWGYWFGPINIVIVVLAVFAARRCKGESYTVWPILALMGCFIGGYMLVNARMRFILPVMPYMIGLATDQGIYWLTRLREHRGLKLV